MLIGIFVYQTHRYNYTQTQTHTHTHTHTHTDSNNGSKDPKPNRAQYLKLIHSNYVLHSLLIIYTNLCMY